jgi:hypothetical protein
LYNKYKPAQYRKPRTPPPANKLKDLSFADIVKNNNRTSLDDSIHAKKIDNKTEDFLKKLMEKF